MKSPTYSKSTVGFDIAGLPETNKLLMMVVEEEGADVKAAKKVHPLRPALAPRPHRPPLRARQA